jgi:hypothetical protein
MSEAGYRYSLEILSEEGKRVGEASVQVDFEPARQWAFLVGLRSNRLRPTVNCAKASVLPLWHPKAGEPYLRGFRVEIAADAGEPITADFTNDYFRPLATQASAVLAERGKLKVGEKFLYLTAAFPEAEAGEAAARPKFKTEEIAPPLSVSDRCIGRFREFATAHADTDAADVPVFIAARILEEAKELTRGSRGAETGGILLGHLHRDPDLAELFVEVTAQVPARFVRSDSESLTFTAETWTDIRGVIELRQSSEMMLGWWHSHPVRDWCKKCPPERQRVCRLACDFLSDQDRHLHRTVFPRAYSVALVMNDVAFEDVTASLFGWKLGRLEPRGFHVLPEDSSVMATPATRHEPAQGGEHATKRKAGA